MKIFFLLFFVLSFSAFGQIDFYDDDDYVLEDLKNQYNQLLDSRYSLFPHKGTFLLPMTTNSMVHENLYSEIRNTEPTRGDYYKSTEAEFQISFMIPVLRSVDYNGWDLLFAYTHHSWWQVYNPVWSRPFRETNYMPEVFTRKLFLKKVAKTNLRLTTLDFGYVHQSNGQIQMLSRSWDRLFARGTFIHDDFMMNVTAWYRLPEKSHEDDNRDIYNYMGIGEVELIKSFGKHTLNFKTPIAFHHFSSDIKYSYPWRDRLRWFFRFQGGYGHSLIEYNRPTQRFGLGIILDEFYNFQ